MPKTKKLLTVETARNGDTFLVIAESDLATGKPVSVPTRLGPFKYSAPDLNGAADRAAAKAFGAEQLTVNELRGFVEALGAEFKALSFAIALRQWFKK